MSVNPAHFTATSSSIVVDALIEMRAQSIYHNIQMNAVLDHGGNVPVRVLRPWDSVQNESRALFRAEAAMQLVADGILRVKAPREFIETHLEQISYDLEQISGYLSLKTGKK